MTTAVGEEVLAEILIGEDTTGLGISGTLTPRTLNVLPTPDGYLKSYNGDVKLFNDSQFTGLKIVDAISFYDVNGRRRRLVITESNNLYEIVGLSAMLVSSLTYPSRLVATNQSMVLVLSKYRGARKFDGLTGLTELGVRLTPPAPDVTISTLYGAGHWAAPTFNYFGHYFTWGVNKSDYNLINPAQDQEDAADAVDRTYEYRARYFNARGQLGPISPPARVVLGPKEADDTPGKRIQLNKFPILRVAHPRGQADIAGFALFRTTDQKSADDLGIYQAHSVVKFPCDRVTDTRADGSLGEVTDFTEGYPSPAGDLFAVFKDTLLIAGDPDNPSVLRHCVPSEYENWPQLLQYQALGNILGVFALSRSVVVVTDRTIETIAIGENGYFYRERFENVSGQTLPSSMVVKGDAVYGFFDGGFAAFDGYTTRKTNDSRRYLISELENSYEPGRAYVTPDGNYLFLRSGKAYVYHVPTGGWFRVEPTSEARCAWFEDAVVYLGGHEGVYAFDKGNFTDGAIEIVLGGMERRGLPNAVRTKRIGSLFVRAMVTGAYSHKVKLFVDQAYAESQVSAKLEPYDANIDHWLDGGQQWDNGMTWSSPREAWFKVDCGAFGSWRNGRSFTLRIEFDDPIQVCAVHASYTVQQELP